MTINELTRANTRWLLAVVGVAFGFYLALAPGMLDRLSPLTGDEPFYVMTAISFVEDGDLDESNNYARADYEQFYPSSPLPADWNGWSSFPRPLPPHPATSELPGLHTKHGIGLSLLIAIPFELFGRTGASLVIVVAAALLAGQMFLLARASGASVRLAAAIALGLAVAMPVGPYAFLIFPAIPSALLLTYAIRRVANGANSLIQWGLAGTAIGFLPWLHQRFAVTSAILALLIVIYATRSRDMRGAVASLAPVVLVGIALLVYNEWLYGIPIQRTEDHAGFSGPVGTLNGAFGLLLDAQWGLLVATPVMLLAIAGIPTWFRSATRLSLTAFAALAPYLAIVAAYSVWWGEWGPPARYLVPAAALAAGPLAAILTNAAVTGRLVALALWLVGMLFTVAGYQDPQRFYHHPDGMNKLIAEASTLLPVDPNRVLVSFQPFAVDSLASRLWVSAFTVALILLTMYRINTPISGASRLINRTRTRLMSNINRP